MSVTLSPGRIFLSLLITPFTTRNSISRLIHLTPSASTVVLDKMQANSSSSFSSKESLISQQIQTFVVCGPSGSGKTTLLNMVTSFYKDCFKFCVSRKESFVMIFVFKVFSTMLADTTRAPRKSEENGKAYHFVTTEEFQRMISENAFVEYAQFSGNYYGTR